VRVPELTDEQMDAGWRRKDPSPSALVHVRALYWVEFPDMGLGAGTHGIFYLTPVSAPDGFYLIPHGRWSDIGIDRAVAGPFDTLETAAGTCRLLDVNSH
jgi:hypothetical protein